MQMLSFDLFLDADMDPEAGQYRVLSGLQSSRRAFQQNVIYPHLAQLIDLERKMQELLDSMEGAIRGAPEGEIETIDLQEGVVVRGERTFGGDQLDRMTHLIRWALPRIQEAIEEGRMVYEFVDENSAIEAIGIVPEYRDEGYLFVPDHLRNELIVLRYRLSIITSEREQYRALRTMTHKVLPDGPVRRPPRRLKLELIRENDELPNPATYQCDVEVAFPFEETVLPIAKRKLMRLLYETG